MDTEEDVNFNSYSRKTEWQQAILMKRLELLHRFFFFMVFETIKEDYINVNLALQKSHTHTNTHTCQKKKSIKPKAKHFITLLVIHHYRIRLAHPAKKFRLTSEHVKCILKKFLHSPRILVVCFVFAFNKHAQVSKKEKIKLSTKGMCPQGQIHSKA